MWQVSPESSNQSFFQEASEALNKSSFIPILQCATTYWEDSGALPFPFSLVLPLAWVLSY